MSAGLALIAFLPGYALLLALWPPSAEPSLTGPEQWLIAVPISYSLTITLFLFMVFARLPLTLFSVAGGLTALTLLFTFIAWRSSPLPSPSSSPYLHPPYYLLPFLAILLSSLFRLVNIHYSDYQGDEADILLRAVSLGSGHLEAILTHSKGPGEILLLNAIGALTGRFDEQAARLPFSLAGVVSVGLIVLLGQELFSRSVGFIAGLLAAIDGVFVSYARTAQYQSLVLLLTLTALYCFYRFYQTGSHSRRWHGLGAFLFAASFLFHFETILLLPVVIYLTLVAETRGGEEAKRRRSEEVETGGDEEAKRQNHASRLTPHASVRSLPLGRLTSLWPSALIFITLVAAFYLPFLLHPNVKSTGSYLENRIGGGSVPPFNNLAHFFYFEALKYNSAYYVILFNALLVLVVVLVLAGVQTKWPGGVARRGQEARSRGAEEKFLPRPSAPLLLCLAVVVLVLGGIGFSLLGQAQLAALLLALGFALFLALVIFSPQTSLPQRILWLWLAPPFLIYVFLVNRPGKHHYLFLGALTLWVSWVAVQGWQWAAKRWPVLYQPAGRWLTLGFGAALLAIFAGHSIMLFLRSDLEYVLTYPAH
ncbi:MAG TPA: glycosyltransferase family 39 protein, partial [Anaerolineae bacterium]|nr:glycosyltransferase family 39 protein [Anaerolineae bacterium]